MPEEFKRRVAALDADAKAVINHLKRQDQEQARYNRERRTRFWIGVLSGAAAVLLVAGVVLGNGFVTRRAVTELYDRDRGALCGIMVPLQQQYEASSPEQRAALSPARRQWYEQNLPEAIDRLGCVR